MLTEYLAKLNKLTEPTAVVTTCGTTDIRARMAEVKVKKETIVSDPAEVENRLETPR